MGLMMTKLSFVILVHRFLIICFFFLLVLGFIVSFLWDLHIWFLFSSSFLRRFFLLFHFILQACGRAITISHPGFSLTLDSVFVWCL